MSVTTTTNRVIVLGDGIATTFEFPFIGVDPGDIFVTYTDPDGASTDLSQSQYSVTLNPALPGAIWGIGGDVTYPLSGSPIPDGSSLTIVRILPETQETQISNQGAFYPRVVEQELDLLMMTIQQVSDQASRALVVPVSDPDVPLPIPGVQQRAGQMLGFDALGNPIAAQPSSALVSSAMQPVVGAATLPLARAAMGVDYPVLVVSANQTPGLDEYGTRYKATTAINIALPGGMFNGYALSLQALSGDSTVTPNGTDSIYGLSPGAPQVVGVGATGQIVFDGVSTWYYDEITPSDYVGLIKDFAGYAENVPAKHAPCDGGAFVRVDFPLLLDRITMQLTAGRTFNSTTLTGFTSDQTDQLATGIPVEGTGIPSGATIASISTNSITLSVTCSSSGTDSIRIFPWGNGNGTTTANRPDLRGISTAGPDRYAGGSSANRLTPTYFGATARIGKTGGGESQTLTQAQMPSYTLPNTLGINDGRTWTTQNTQIAVGSGTVFSQTSGSGAVLAGNGVNVSGSITVTGSVTSGGSGSAHTIVQPTAIVNKIIRVLN